MKWTVEIALRTPSRILISLAKLWRLTNKFILDIPHPLNHRIFPSCNSISAMVETTSDALSSAFMTDFLRKASGTAIIDGGLATELERHGADLNDSLWSAKCLLTSPHLIHTVYLQLVVSYLFLYWWFGRRKMLTLV